MNKARLLLHRLADQRSRQVVFLSHCLLNENTRYLGGACTRGCVPGVLEQCVNRGIGIVQMPCPEEEVWGGVLKRWMLVSYGSKGSLLYQLHPVLLPLFLVYTRLRYRCIARRIADQIHDYLASGFTVLGVMGVDGSPSCGVQTTLAMRSAFERTAAVNLATINPTRMNRLLRLSLQPGRGLFIAALQRALLRRGIILPFRAHDLMAELAGKPVQCTIPGEPDYPTYN